MPAVLRNGHIGSRAAIPFIVSAADTSPPSTPPNFTYTNLTTTTVDLTWSPSTDNGGSGLTGYNVYEVIGGSDVFKSFKAASPYPITGLAAGSTHTYRVVAVDGAGNVSVPATTTITTNSVPDTTPPTNPTSITSTAHNNSVDLSWTASTDIGGSGVAGYNVYLVSGGVDVLNNATLISDNSYTIPSLQPGVSYTAKVEAVDNVGNKSGKVAKNFTTTTPNDTIPPTAPSNPQHSNDTAGGTTLTWGASTDNQSGVKQYELVRNQIVEFTTTSLTFTITSLDPSTTYTYAVRARDNSDNVSTGNSTVTFTTLDPADTTPPNAPTSPTTSNITQTSVNLAWVASTSTDVAGYEIASQGNVLKTGITGTSTKVPSLTAGTHYDMAIKAYDTSGNRSISNPTVSFKTSAVTSGNPFNRNVGFTEGNGATVAMLNAVGDKVNGTGAATSGGRTALLRLGVNWPNFGATDSPTAWPSGQGAPPWNALADAAVANGMQIHCGLFYASPAYTQTIKFADVDAVATPGNTFLSLVKPGTTTAQSSAFGPPNKGRFDGTDAQTSAGWLNLSVHHSSIPTGQGIVCSGIPSPGTQVKLATYVNGKFVPWTIPAGAGGRDNVVIGGGGGQQDQKLLPKCSPTNTTSLEAYGNYAFSIITLLGDRVATCEMGNERNGILGTQPYVDIALVFRNLCHGYCGVKLANPNVLVGCASVADNQTVGKGYYTAVDFHTALIAEASNQATYFSDLKTNLGVSSQDEHPFDFIITHPYQTTPLSPTEGPMAESAAIYNMYGGAKRLMFGEQGCHWDQNGTRSLGQTQNETQDANGNYINLLTAQGGADWYQAIFDHAHGNIPWNKSPAFIGTDGTNLGKPTGDGTGGTITVQNRRIAARNIFMPVLMFVMRAQADYPHFGFFVYQANTPKWTANGPDPVNTMRLLT